MKLLLYSPYMPSSGSWSKLPVPGGPEEGPRPNCVAKGFVVHGSIITVDCFVVHGSIITADCFVVHGNIITADCFVVHGSIITVDCFVVHGSIITVDCTN